VLATAGGGEDGFFLLETFMRVAESADWEGIAVAGPLSPELEALQRLAARTNVTLHTFVPDLSQLFGSIDALVCMGGYNTLAEAVSKGVPTVCVPRTVPRREQLIRALAFERLGLLRVIEPGRLTTGTLGKVIQSVIREKRAKMPSRADLPLSFDGAWRAASQLLVLSPPACCRSATQPESHAPGLGRVGLGRAEPAWAPVTELRQRRRHERMKKRENTLLSKRIIGRERNQRSERISA
jgi:predicted glycosyltransferase